MKQRVDERLVADRQNLEAQTASSNAATASVAIASKQCEKFGTFLSLYAQKHFRSVPRSSVAPPNLPDHTPLQMDPDLLAPPSVPDPTAGGGDDDYLEGVLNNTDIV